MTTSSRRSARDVAPLAAMFFAALALRPQILAVGALLTDIQRDLDLSHFAAGLVSTIPVLCMGLFAPPAGALTRYRGTRFAVGASLGLIAVFGVLRCLASSAAGLIALTIPVGIGMGLAGALLPIVVKERLSSRPAFATGVYSTGLQLGAAGAAAAAIPLSLTLGGWRGALIAISVATGGTVAAWLLLVPRRRLAAPVSFIASPKLPIRSWLGFLLALAFGLQSMVFYGLSTWLVPAYVERGWDQQHAALLLSLTVLVAVPAGLVLPWLADRAGSRQVYLMLSASLLFAAMLGFAAVPDGAWVWAVLFGAGAGVILPVLLTLPLDAADDPLDVGALAALMLLGGYTLSAVSPVLLGSARDATGSFAASLWLLVAFSGALVALAVALTPRRLETLAAKLNRRSGSAG